MFAVAGLVVSLHQAAYPTLSPIDELQHLDYLAKASSGDLVRMGDRVGQEAMAEEACRGIDAEGFEPPPCSASGRYDPLQFQEAGFNTADIHPPTYYALTGVAARLVGAIFGIESLLFSGRMMGIAWLAVAGSLIWGLGGRLGLERMPTIIVLGLVVTTPAVIHATATVNPDASALAAGAAIVTVTLLWEDGRLSIWPLPLTALVVVSLKATFGLAVGMMVLYLLLRRWSVRRSGDDEAPRGYVGAAVWLLGGGVVAVLVWSAMHSALAYVSTNPQIDRFRVDALNLDQVVSQVTAMVTPIVNPYIPSFLAGATVVVLVQLFNMGLIGASVAPALSRGGVSRSDALGLAAFATVLSGGVLMTLANFFLNSQIFVPIPARYGLSVLPGLALALAGRLRRPVTVWAAGALASLSLVVVLVELVNQ